MTDEEMILAYTVEQLSTSEIGRKIGMSPAWVSEVLKRNGVQMRTKGNDLRPSRVAERLAWSRMGAERPFEDRDEDYIAAVFRASPRGFLGRWSEKPGGWLHGRAIT